MCALGFAALFAHQHGLPPRAMPNKACEHGNEDEPREYNEAVVECLVSEVVLVLLAVLVVLPVVPVVVVVWRWVVVAVEGGGRKLDM